MESRLGKRFTRDRYSKFRRRFIPIHTVLTPMGKLEFELNQTQTIS